MCKDSRDTLTVVACQALGFLCHTLHLLQPLQVLKELPISASPASVRRLWEVHSPTLHSDKARGRVHPRLRPGTGLRTNRRIPGCKPHVDWEAAADLRLPLWAVLEAESCWGLVGGTRLAEGPGAGWQLVALDGLAYQLLFPHRNDSILIYWVLSFSKESLVIQMFTWVRLGLASFFWGEVVKEKGMFRSTGFEIKHVPPRLQAFQQVSRTLFSCLNKTVKIPTFKN